MIHSSSRWKFLKNDLKTQRRKLGHAKSLSKERIPSCCQDFFSWKRKWQISRFPPQSENCVFFKKEYLFQKNRWKFMKLMFCRGESCCVDPLGWWFVKKITLHYTTLQFRYTAVIFQWYGSISTSTEKYLLFSIFRRA